MRGAVWHPFTQHGLEEVIPLVTHAEGAAIHTSDGRRIIDAISSWWVTTHGHCHPPIMQAIADQAGRLDQIIFAGWTHEPAETLAQGLVAMMPRPLTHVFFSDSGSTSVEVALKMALGYWVNRGEPRHRIIVMEHSYHGDTIGAMAVGARGVFNQAYQPLLFDVDRIPFPAKGMEQATLDALDHLCRHAAPAALIVEPLILGAGGMLIYGAATLAQMRAICAHHGVLFIADEVMTGWGRTGALLACNHAGVVPDILCLSKGLTGGAIPLAVTMASPAIYDAHYSTDSARQFFHSSSYTANPIACAAANANLAIWREEPVLDRIADLARRQSAALRALVSGAGGQSGAEHALINARQLGTITAFDLAADQPGYLASVGLRLRHWAAAHNILLRPLGNSVYIMPPYCIDDADLTAIYDAIAAFLVA